VAGTRVLGTVMRGFHCLVMFFGLLLVAGSAAAEKMSAPITAQTRLVLVSSDTWLYSAPDEKSYRFRVRGPMPKSIWAKPSRPFNSKDRLMRTLLFVMQGKVPDKPGWLHLRSLADSTQVGNNCAHPTPGRGLVIDLYVRSDRLLDTLKKPFQASYEDGTELHLLPGVLIRPGKYKGRYIAETPFLQVELALPPNSITQSFAPHPGFGIDKAAVFTEGPLELRVGPRIRAVLLDKVIGLQAKPIKRGNKAWLLYDSVGCAKVRGVGSIKSLGDADPATPSILYTYPEKYLKIAPGSQVFWRDGSLAGHTGKAFAFDPNQQVRSPLDNFLCIHHEFFADKDYTLCFIHEAEDDR